MAEGHEQRTPDRQRTPRSVTPSRAVYPDFESAHASILAGRYSAENSPFRRRGLSDPGREGVETGQPASVLPPIPRLPSWALPADRHRTGRAATDQNVAGPSDAHNIAGVPLGQNDIAMVSLPVASHFDGGVDRLRQLRRSRSLSSLDPSREIQDMIDLALLDEGESIVSRSSVSRRPRFVSGPGNSASVRPYSVEYVSENDEVEVADSFVQRQGNASPVEMVEPLRFKRASKSASDANDSDRDWVTVRDSVVTERTSEPDNEYNTSSFTNSAVLSLASRPESARSPLFDPRTNLVDFGPLLESSGLEGQVSDSDEKDQSVQDSTYRSLVSRTHDFNTKPRGRAWPHLITSQLPAALPSSSLLGPAIADLDKDSDHSQSETAPDKPHSQSSVGEQPPSVTGDPTFQVVDSTSSSKRRNRKKKMGRRNKTKAASQTSNSTENLTKDSDASSSTKVGQSTPPAESTYADVRRQLELCDPDNDADVAAFLFNNRFVDLEAIRREAIRRNAPNRARSTADDVKKAGRADPARPIEAGDLASSSTVKGKGKAAESAELAEPTPEVADNAGVRPVEPARPHSPLVLQRGQVFFYRNDALTTSMEGLDKPRYTGRPGTTEAPDRVHMPTECPKFPLREDQFGIKMPDPDRRMTCERMERRADGGWLEKAYCFKHRRWEFSHTGTLTKRRVREEDRPAQRAAGRHAIIVGCLLFPFGGFQLLDDLERDDGSAPDVMRVFGGPGIDQVHADDRRRAGIMKEVMIYAWMTVVAVAFGVVAAVLWNEMY